MNEEVMTNGADEVFEDETLVCKECGKEFVFTAGEQKFYKEKGFQNKPQRCKERGQSTERVFHHHLRRLRWRGKGDFPALQRQTCILQRLL